MKTKLKPCPMCGKEIAVVFSRVGNEGFYAMCIQKAGSYHKNLVQITIHEDRT